MCLCNASLRKTALTLSFTQKPLYFREKKLKINIFRIAARLIVDTVNTLIESVIINVLAFASNSWAHLTVAGATCN